MQVGVFRRISRIVEELYVFYLYAYTSFMHHCWKTVENFYFKKFIRVMRMSESPWRKKTLDFHHSYFCGLVICFSLQSCDASYFWSKLEVRQWVLVNLNSLSLLRNQRPLRVFHTTKLWSIILFFRVQNDNTTVGFSRL